MARKPTQEGMVTERELKAFKGQCGKVLLDYIRTLPKSKLKKMRTRMSKLGMRPEHDGKPPTYEKKHRENEGPVRTSTGYVWR